MHPRAPKSDILKEQDLDYLPDAEADGDGGVHLSLPDQREFTPDEFSDRLKKLYTAENTLLKPRKVAIIPDPNKTTEITEATMSIDGHEALKTSKSVTTLLPPISKEAIEALQTIYPGEKRLVVESGGLKGCLQLIKDGSKDVIYEFSQAVIDKISKMPESEGKQQFMQYCRDNKLIAEDRRHISPG